jgi:hypothetical protein
VVFTTPAWCSGAVDSCGNRAGATTNWFEISEEDILELVCMDRKTRKTVDLETSPANAEEDSDLVLAAVCFGLKLQDEHQIQSVVCLSPSWGGISVLRRMCERVKEHCAVIETDVFADKAYSCDAVLDCLQTVCTAELPTNFFEYHDITIRGTFEAFWLGF